MSLAQRIAETISTGLDRASARAPKSGELDLGVIVERRGDVTRAALAAELEARLSESWSAYGKASAGITRDALRSELEAILAAGLRARW